MPVTQKHIAEHLGLSLAWVTRALNDHPTVPDATRQRVREAAREMGYDEYSNSEARALIARRYGTHRETRVIGWVFDRISINDYYGAGVYQGMQDAAEEHDYDLLNLIRMREVRKPEHEGLQYLDHRTDGLVFLVPHGREELLETLVQHNIPVATIGMKAAPGVAHIKPDNAGMARVAVEYLVQRGHTRIAHLSGPKCHGDYAERCEGFVAAMKSTGLKNSASPIVSNGMGDGPEWPIDVVAMRALLQSGITAVVCGNDNIAQAMWRVAEESGWQIPRDLSIIGMDDLPGSQERGLTTLRLSFHDMGRVALNAVVKIINGAKAEECNAVLPAQLIERASVEPLTNA